MTFTYDIYIWHVVLYIFHDCFQNSREKCIEYIFHDCFQNSREKCIGSPNPLFYRCKFSRRLQIRLLFRKTAARIGDTEANWRLPSSPIVEKKHVHFPTVNSNSREKCIEYIFHDCFQNSREKCIGSPNPLIYRCKFSPLLK